MIQRLLAALLLFGVMPAAAAQPDPAPAPERAERPIEAFATLPSISGAILSPDGTRIAGKMRAGNQQLLAIVTIGGSEPPAFVSNAGLFDINDWQWVNDDWLVVSLGQADNSLGQDMYVTRLLGVDRRGRTINQLNWRNAGQTASDIIWIARDGSPRILFGMQTAYSGPNFWPKVFEADVSTGRTRMVVGSNDYVMNWFADSGGTVRMATAMTTRPARHGSSTAPAQTKASAPSRAPIPVARSRCPRPPCSCPTPAAPSPYPTMRVSAPPTK